MRRTSQPPPPPRSRPMNRRRGAGTKQLTNIKKFCTRRLEQQRLWSGCPLIQRTSDELVLKRGRTQGGCSWSFLDSTNNIYPASNGLRQLSHLGSVMWILFFISNILLKPLPLVDLCLRTPQSAARRADDLLQIASSHDREIINSTSHIHSFVLVFQTFSPSDKPLDLKISPLLNETCVFFQSLISHAPKTGMLKSS